MAVNCYSIVSWKSFFFFSLFQAGREGREKFGRKQQRMNPHASTTNKEKRKNKPFMMVKQKHTIKHKQKRSFREKQVGLLFIDDQTWGDSKMLRSFHQRHSCTEFDWITVFIISTSTWMMYIQAPCDICTSFWMLLAAYLNSSPFHPSWCIQDIKSLIILFPSSTPGYIKSFCQRG